MCVGREGGGVVVCECGLASQKSVFVWLGGSDSAIPKSSSNSSSQQHALPKPYALGQTPVKTPLNPEPCPQNRTTHLQQR